MALFACKVGGSEGGGLNVSNADFHFRSPVQVNAGHVVIASTFQAAFGNGSGSSAIHATLTISGTEGTDYEIIYHDNTEKPLVTALGNQPNDVQLFDTYVIKAINNITITASFGGGQNYNAGGFLVYDLS